MQRLTYIIIVLFAFCCCCGGSQPKQKEHNQSNNTDSLTARQYKESGKEKSSRGNKQGAIEDYTLAIQLNPDYDTAYYNRAVVRLYLGDAKGAVADCSKALEINHIYVKVYVCRGNAKSALGDRKGAISDYDKAIEINPLNGDAYINRGVERYEMGDTEGEISDYRKALEIAKETGDASLGVDVSNNLGRTLYDLKRFKESAEAYTIGIELSPENGRLYYGRGLAKNQSGDRSGACNDWHKSLSLGCNEAALLLTTCK